MIFKFGILLATYACSASALPPCVCTRDFSPVCGSDGQTYANKCLLDCAHLSNNDLTMVRPGQCEQATCICTYQYKPVCGSDGETYPNECSLNCQRTRNPVLEPKYDGPCKSEQIKGDCVCTLELKPVCGSDGVTYSNPCLLNCNAATKPQLTVKYVGPCRDEVKVAELAVPPSCSCMRNLQPVCGTDGLTYNNPCLLNCAAQSKPLAMKAEGPCDDSNAVKAVEQPQPSASCACTRNYMPVCGSDGKTYPNPCVLGCATNDHPGLKLFHVGPCDQGLQVDVVEHPVY